jgi:hypothetical protein
MRPSSVLHFLPKAHHPPVGLGFPPVPTEHVAHIHLTRASRSLYSLARMKVFIDGE